MTAGKNKMTGHEARSAKTRAQLIDAAIEVIAAVGYEGATTRALSKAAKTTLSAIPYHFGSKEKLYLAAAEKIAEYAAIRFQEAMTELDKSSESDLLVGFEKSLIALLHVLLKEAEPNAWTSFVARCAYDNDEAFALIHERAIEPMLNRLLQAASGFSGLEPDDEALRLRINAIVTAIFSFRFLRGVILRGMSWENLQNEAIKQVTEMVSDLCDSGFIVIDRTQK